MKDNLIESLLTEAAPPQAPMRMPDLVEPIKANLARLFPTSVFSVEFDTGICDSVTVRFALEPRDQWPNQIWHNATNVLLMIWPRARKGRDDGSGQFQVTCSMCSRKLPVKFLGRSGSGPVIVAHINRFFDRVKQALDQTAKPT